MCKHILNAQTYIRAPCCMRWFECAECHDEREPTHKFQHSKILRFVCKSCRKCFDRDFTIFPDSDMKCDFCHNLWCLPAITPESKIYEECNFMLDQYFQAMLDETNEFFIKIPEK
eukprot:gene18970-24781_t